jgi:hypothetical protein
MLRTSNSLAVLCAVLALSACGGPSPQEQIETSERAAMTPVKDTYPDVVMGFDFHGPVVDMSVDLNKEIDMDDPAEAAMKADALKRWRAAWLQTHPHQHAMLTVRILDFRGTVTWKQTEKV